MMALVYRRNDKGSELLLTRKAGYAEGRYTVVAGFVEAGESLEQCLAREVKEEVGVDIRNPRYFGSQPWPRLAGWFAVWEASALFERVMHKYAPWHPGQATTIFPAQDAGPRCLMPAGTA